ncbi:MAG: iron-sulfur cluster repair di-iron protein [Bacteroidetes bacterium]|nr:iron-sulfur cluster repair di-iron protein [Bacteroidota bacterium]
METLDVTVIEPRLKHPTIFEKFDALPGGESFVIHNDHDPKPLYYQLVAERGQTFDWEYLLSGPEIWEVKISKLNIGEKPASIGELVASDFRKAEVFRKFGLDFCCGGKKSIKEACDEKGLDTTEVEKALKAVENLPKVREDDFNSWELDFLADYIVNTHHSYVTNAMPILDEFSSKVARVHGATHPEVVLIAQHYNAVANELRAHMPKEELMLFPYIKQMVAAKKEGLKLQPAGFGTIENPIRMMEAEHVSAGDNMEKVRQLSNDFTLPADACASYGVLFGKLEEFEQDLHRHIHLENNILFKKAIALEKELLG